MYSVGTELGLVLVCSGESNTFMLKADCRQRPPGVLKHCPLKDDKYQRACKIMIIKTITGRRARPEPQNQGADVKHARTGPCCFAFAWTELWGVSFVTFCELRSMNIMRVVAGGYKEISRSRSICPDMYIICPFD